MIIQLLLSVSFFSVTALYGQQDPEMQLENNAAATENVTEDDSRDLDIDFLRRHPLRLNSVSETDMRNSGLFTAEQAVLLKRYIASYGSLLHLHELLAVPGFDADFIRQIAPYVSIDQPHSLLAVAGNRLKDGEHQLLFRTAVSFPNDANFSKPDSLNGYLGSPVQAMFRYTYRYRNLLQYGVIGEKDAGESFFRKQQRAGFDFYSAHLFLRQFKRIRSLAIGDYSVNLGQGLIHWQSLAFGKSTELLNIKRQSAVLRPYHSAGELNFMRGAATTLKIMKGELTLFISSNKTDANIQQDSAGNKWISSFLTGGYHRNNSELADRKQVAANTAGGAYLYNFGHGHVSYNTVQYHYNLPVQKRNEPYNLYSLTGKSWFNHSIDYSLNFHQLHLFGELAMDKNKNPAVVQGLLFSPGTTTDIALLYRNISPAYQSVNGNAFTENSMPVNERGFFTGISIRPVPGLKLEAFADLFSFPWLRYRTDKPGIGSEFVIQLAYSPTKETLILSRIMVKNKEENYLTDEGTTASVHSNSLQKWRTQFNFRVLPSVLCRNRVELAWFNLRSTDQQKGSLYYTDLIYNPLVSKWAVGFRLQYVETDGYESRIYAYENDVLFSHSIPAFSGRIFRAYLNVSCAVNKAFNCWLKFSLNRYPSIYYGDFSSDVEAGEISTSLRLQVRYTFK